jgi:hypothetical protein
MHDQNDKWAKLPTLQSRRQKQRLIFFNKVVEGQVPAMPPDLFVKYQKSKRQIRAKKIDNSITNNIVTSSVRNNSKCIVIAPNRTDQYKHSFFVQTAVDWNHLDENTVSAEKLESLKSALADHRDQVALHPSYHSPAGIIWRNITDDFQRNFIIFHTGRYLACFRHIFRELRYSFFLC